MPSFPTTLTQARNSIRGVLKQQLEAGRDPLALQIAVYEVLRELGINTSYSASHWKTNGEPDPHEGKYDGDRADLTLGKLTDDELANAAFMNYDVRPPIKDLLDGTAHMPIVYMQAVKDRIRWLSRQLAKATAPRLTAPTTHKDPEQ